MVTIRALYGVPYGKMGPRWTLHGHASRACTALGHLLERPYAASTLLIFPTIDLGISFTTAALLTMGATSFKIPVYGPSDLFVCYRITTLLHCLAPHLTSAYRPRGPCLAGHP